MQIKRGQASNITPVEKPQGAVECELDTIKILLNRDLADKVNNGDDIQIAGKPIDNGLVHVFAINNLSKNKITQVDLTNYALALGLSGFTAIAGGAQAINYISWGNPAIASGLAFASVAGIFGMVFTTLRIIEISKASSRVKYISP